MAFQPQPAQNQEPRPPEEQLRVAGVHPELLEDEVAQDLRIGQHTQLVKCTLSAQQRLVRPP